jgi:hypothetical protein
VGAAYACGDASAPNGAAVSCTGTVANGAQLPDAAAGLRTFTVTATNAYGASVTKTVQYSVVYEFSGFGGVVRNFPAVNTWVAPVPIVFQFTLKDWNQVPFTGLNSGNVTVQFQPVACNSGTPTGAPLAGINAVLDASNGTALVTDVPPLGINGQCALAQVTLFNDAPVDTHTAWFQFGTGAPLPPLLGGLGL